MLLQIPLKSVPCQVLTANLNGQQVTIELFQNSLLNESGVVTSVFANLFLGQTQLYNMAKCNNLCYINQYKDAFNGYLFFASEDNSEPNYNNFATNCKLYYADYDAIDEYYQQWVIFNKSRLSI